MNIWRNSHSLSPQLKQLNSCANCMIWTICNHKINLLRRSFALKFQTPVIGLLQWGAWMFLPTRRLYFPALKTILRQRLRSLILWYKLVPMSSYDLIPYETYHGYDFGKLLKPPVHLTNESRKHHFFIFRLNS